VIAISLDEQLDAAQFCAREESTVPLMYTVLIDRDHAWAEAYGVINIPTSIWVDEDDRLVRPPSIAPAEHHDALRRWVIDGVEPMSSDEFGARRQPPTFELQLARAERRLAMHLLREGHEEAGNAHLSRALELAPDDWTIHRGSMPVRGLDPFGQEFFDFYERWQAAGRPGYAS
jgi:hypothetical protein